MKKKLLFLFFTLIATCSYGQLYMYTYDAAGNRIVRRYSVNGMPLLNEDDEDKGEVQLSKMLQKHQIDINLTEKKEINIRVSNVNKDTQGEISIYSTNGIQMNKIAIREENTTVDMSKLEAGVYIIMVTVDGQSTSWKILKE